MSRAGPARHARTVGELLRLTAERVPDREALVFESVRWTYRELLDRVDRLAAGLRGLGLEKGDRLGLYLANSHRAYQALLAAARSGLVTVPLNPMLSGSELAAIICHAGVRALMVAPELYPILAPVLPELPRVEHVIGLEGVEGISVGFEDLDEGGAGAAPGEAVGGEDLFGLMYTSGTTGLPKGVALTHRNIVTHARHMVRDYGIGENSRGFIVLPYFVGASLNGIGLPCLSQGGTVVILRRFTPGGFLQTVEAEGITHVQTVPTLIVRLLESEAVGNHDIGSLEVFGYGSAPMPVDRLRQALRTFGPIFVQMYGLTETCAMATCLGKDEHVLEGPGAERLKSCGRAVKGVEVGIVNDKGEDVAVGEVGEVVIRGPTVMSGYWDMPELSTEALAGGWFHSGDLAYRDGDGYIYLTDRKKDTIITGGFKVYPREVEEVLYTHPAVLECAVVGEPHPDWGETVSAFVTLRRDMRAGQRDLLDFCRDRLSAFKRPKSVVLVDEIPRNPSGKVLKRVLRGEAKPCVSSGPAALSGGAARTPNP